MATAKKHSALRGRPPQDFARDPRRYAIAIALGLERLGLSENAAFGLVAALVLGRKISEHQTPARPRRGVGTIPPGRQADYERAWHLNTTSASFKGFRTTLRKKLHRIEDDSEAMLWLAATARGIAAFLSTGYLLDFDAEQLLMHVVVCADRATSGTLPVPFLFALNFDMPELVTKDNAPE
jgi:hypothetical protein